MYDRPGLPRHPTPTMAMLAVKPNQMTMTALTQLQKQLM
jgi:hypothetical protein